MSTLSIRLPQSLHGELRKAAKREEVSINQLVLVAVTRQIASGSLEQFVAERGGPVSPEEFSEILNSVPDAPPVPGDELPEGYTAPQSREEKTS